MWVHTPEEGLTNLSLIRHLAIERDTDRSSIEQLYKLTAYGSYPQGKASVVKGNKELCEAMLEEISRRLSRQELFYDAREFRMPSNETTDTP